MTLAPGLLPALQRRVDELMPAVEGVPAPRLRLGRLGPRAALIGASIAARHALTTGLLSRPGPRRVTPEATPELADVVAFRRRAS